MTLICIVLVIWLLPAILSYVLVSIDSHSWEPDTKDVIVLIPVVNIVVLGLVLIIMLDERIISRQIDPNDEEND